MIDAAAGLDPRPMHTAPTGSRKVEQFLLTDRQRSTAQSLVGTAAHL